MTRGRSNAVTSRSPSAFNGGEKLKPSGSAPSHPMLGMLRAVGNQAAQAIHAPPVTSDYDSTTVSSSPGPASSTPPGYSAYTSMPAFPTASSSAPASPSPSPSSGPAPSAPPGYSAYTAMPALPAAPVAPSGADPSSAPYAPVYTNPYDAPLAPSASSSSGAAPASPAPVPAAPTGRARSNATASGGPALPGFDMKDMNAGMTEFDTELQPEGMAHAPLPSTTHYMKTPAERQDHARGFDKDGKMINKNTGSELSTIGAKAAPAHGSKPDRHIFTMDGKGQFHSADAIHETTSRGHEAAAQGKDTQERFHHSTFNAGQAVAGAGELQVRDGSVELVSDTSGHYHPGSSQMMQTVQQLEKNNVNMEKMGVEFSAKRGNKAMQASAIELLGYANHKPEQAEDQMRAKHGKKDQVLGELKAAGAGAAEGQNLSPSEIKKAQKEKKAALAIAPTRESESAEKEDYN